MSWRLSNRVYGIDLGVYAEPRERESRVDGAQLAERTSRSVGASAQLNHLAPWVYDRRSACGNKELAFIHSRPDFPSHSACARTPQDVRTCLQMGRHW